MKPIRLFVLVGLLVGLLAQPGCISPITPQTADLEHVHELYAGEFTALVSPVPANGNPPASPAGSGAAFAQSLRAIHEYRIKYPKETQQLAHLQVLEGMIYLQSGRFGLATAMKASIAKAESDLNSAKGLMVRDRIFAQNFGLLLEGWTEAKKENERKWQTFEHVADELAKAINEIPSNERADVDVDQGALYIAASSAIFYVWAFSEISSSHDRALAPDKKKEWYRKGRDLIGPFLTDEEKAADTANDLGAAEQGRLRYVNWYHWLDKEAGASPH